MGSRRVEVWPLQRIYHWPFQVIGILLVVFIALVFLVGVFAPGYYDCFIPPKEDESAIGGEISMPNEVNANGEDVEAKGERAKGREVYAIDEEIEAEGEEAKDVEAGAQ